MISDAPDFGEQEWVWRIYFLRKLSGNCDYSAIFCNFWLRLCHGSNFPGLQRIVWFWDWAGMRVH